jgi:hypothetical protein
VPEPAMLQKIYSAIQQLRVVSIIDLRLVNLKIKVKSGIMSG